MNLSAHDRGILRDLGRRVAAVGALPVQKERATLWQKHNDLKPGRPLVLIFPEGAWREMLTDKDFATQSPEARGFEWDLRARLYYAEHLPDDNVIEPVIASYAEVKDTGWGISARRTPSGQLAGADHFEPVIVNEEDIEKIGMPQVSIDREASDRRYQELSELYDGILTVERRAHAYNGFAILDEFATWRGLDQMFIDLVDRPEWVHRVMEKMCCGVEARQDAMVRSGWVTLNNRNHYTGSGGTGYTSQLPRPGFDGAHARLQDLWGFATTQMFSEVSPAMHEEFALRYEKRLLERFGLSSYGCCEPLHRKMDLVKSIRNVRRISVSPWADLRTSADALENRYVFSWKPNPAMLASEVWNPDAVRKSLREGLEVTKGCVVEIIMKDTHTCRHEPRRMWEWVRLAREEAERIAG